MAGMTRLEYAEMLLGLAADKSRDPKKREYAKEMLKSIKEAQDKKQAEEKA